MVYAHESALVEAILSLYLACFTFSWTLFSFRSYMTPPSMVVHVMSAVCLLLQQPTDWSTVKHLMADPMAFLKRLTSFDKDHVPDKVITISFVREGQVYLRICNASQSSVKNDNLLFCSQVLSKLRKFTRDPNFSPDKVAHYSVACQSFCQWVLAIEHYGEVYRVVQPKRQLYQEMELKLQSVRSKLQGKETQLKEVLHSHSWVVSAAQKWLTNKY